LPFHIDNFVRECRAARADPTAPSLIADIVSRALADPVAIADAVAERKAERGSDAMAEIFINEDDLTIYQVSFPPSLFGVPHDHAGWAVIGVYSGTEAFNLYEERGGKLSRLGRTVMSAPAVEVLPPELIHDIDNPGPGISGSIHVYSNRHFDVPQRRIWRDGADSAEPFTLQRSYEYGMELTARRRGELGLPPSATPKLPQVGSDFSG
jgi:predicted metal-dependent enzyme (double-stranded beta helix superfamily)